MSELLGIHKCFLYKSILSNSLKEETLNDGSQRTVLSIPAILAPIKVAVLPLVNKDGLPEIAINIFNKLKLDFNSSYDHKDAIGRRYRRQDALGTPFCITIDHQTLEDQTITVRYRDTMNQERISLKDVSKKIQSEVSFKNWIKKV